MKHASAKESSPILLLIELESISPAAILDGRQIISVEAIDAALRDLRKLVCKYFVDEEIKCFIIIDSLELYPVESPKFVKVISGFLKCINEFNDDNPNTRVICCVPEEIEHILITGSSNKLKDLTGAASLSRLKWRPIDLLRIVAERYRDFVRIHGEDDRKFVDKIDCLNFADRKNLRSFFDEVLPQSITNRFGQKENTLAYIVRHTQLLPREFILLFNRAIIHSHAEHGSWRFIDQHAIVKAVQDQEPELADQILGPYQPLYPELIKHARAVISELRPIFTKSDADRLGGRLKAVRRELEDPWAMLFDIGVVGYIDNPHEGKGGEVYEYARFHFNSSSKLTVASNRRYCVHPIFSGTWGTAIRRSRCPRQVYISGGCGDRHMGSLSVVRPYAVTAIGVAAYIVLSFVIASLLDDSGIVSRSGSVLSAIGAIAVIWQVVVEERLTSGNTADQQAAAIRDLSPENAQLARRIAEERTEVRREERLRVVSCIAATVFFGEMCHGWGDLVARQVLHIH